jgi:hypothetical protein
VINHIDLSTVLRRTVCDLYSDLVTRPTGAAVRTGIEQQLEEIGDRTLTVIDFSHVGLLDFSCADEIVAKLLLRYGHEMSGREVYFLFRGVSDSHLDAIETVLTTHRLAIVAESDYGARMLVGNVDEGERRAWEAMCRLGRAVVADISDLCVLVGMDQEQTEALLDGMCRRRLVMRHEEGYIAIGASS